MEVGAVCGARVILRGMQPFVGSEALACGAVSRHQLRTHCRTVFPDVYVPKAVEPSLELRIAAAWLWSRGRAVISGAAAAFCHGTRWIPDDVPIELVCSNNRPPPGIVTRRYRLADGETQALRGYALTTPERTAFDIGRGGAIRSAVVRLDALARATGFKVDDVLHIARDHARSPGLRRLETALEFVDAGAESPRESYLRLLLIDAGLPRPRTQVPVLGVDGMPVAFLDLGWEEHMVAVEYDGDHHRSDRRQYLKDIRRLEMLEGMGWIVVRVVAEDHPFDVLRRVRAALAASSVK
jgi:very-short-patch-repair endonuclease